MSPSDFNSPVFDEWTYSHPTERCYRWKRDDAVAEMTKWADGWTVWIREDDSDKVFDRGFDKQDGFRFLQNQLRVVNLVVFDDGSSPPQS